MTTEMTNARERWIDGVHCWVTETFNVDFERRVRGPGKFTAVIGTKEHNTPVPGTFASMEALYPVIRRTIRDQNIKPTLANGHGRGAPRRQVKLTPADIDLLHEILARERLAKGE